MQEHKKHEIPAIFINKVSKIYSQGDEEIKAINNLTMVIPQGKMAALVGPSGSGKSTLLHIAGLLDTVTSGTVTLMGNDFTNSSNNTRTEYRRANIGFIYQFHHLLAELSAVENIMMPLLINGIDRKKAYDIAQNILIQVGLKNRANHRPGEMSGGEQQRVAVARALVKRPKILLADEPTGNLDNKNSEKIFALITDIAAEYNCSGIVVTHNLTLAQKYLTKSK